MPVPPELARLAALCADLPAVYSIADVSTPPSAANARYSIRFEGELGQDRLDELREYLAQAKDFLSLNPSLEPDTVIAEFRGHEALPWLQRQLVPRLPMSAIVFVRAGQLGTIEVRVRVIGAHTGVQFGALVTDLKALLGRRRVDTDPLNLAIILTLEPGVLNLRDPRDYLAQLERRVYCALAYWPA